MSQSQVDDPHVLRIMVSTDNHLVCCRGSPVMQFKGSPERWGPPEQHSCRQLEVSYNRKLLAIALEDQG